MRFLEQPETLSGVAGNDLLTGINLIQSRFTGTTTSPLGASF